MGFEGVAGGVERAVQVVGGRLGFEVRPEQVHHLLAVHPVVRSQGEHLDETPGFAPSPATPFDDS